MVTEKKSDIAKEEKETGRKPDNAMELCFDAISVNESLARMALQAFITPYDPTMEEIADLKTAVSEAVTNAIIHGYENLYGYGKYGNQTPAYIEIRPGRVMMRLKMTGEVLTIEVEDNGKGIENIKRAMEPLYTTKPEYNRSGMGFAFMEAFTDDLEVLSTPGAGTLVRMKKKLGCGSWIEE